MGLVTNIITRCKPMICRMIIGMVMVLGLCVSCTPNTSAMSEGKREAKSIKGIEFIEGLPLEESVKQYFEYIQEDNYRGEYASMSKKHLKEYFPEIKNAEGYAELQRNTSEVTNISILKISDVKKENDKKYSIQIIYESISEGELYKLKSTLYFINESGEWKYDGFDMKSDEYL